MPFSYRNPRPLTAQAIRSSPSKELPLLPQLSKLSITIYQYSLLSNLWLGVDPGDGIAATGSAGFRLGREVDRGEDGLHGRGFGDAFEGPLCGAADGAFRPDEPDVDAAALIGDPKTVRTLSNALTPPAS
jgi:hypothetical protein